MSSKTLWHLLVIFVLTVHMTYTQNANTEDVTSSPELNSSQTEVNEGEDEAEDDGIDGSTTVPPLSNITVNETNIDYDDNGTLPTEEPDENTTTFTTELPTTLPPSPANTNTELIVDDFCLCDLKVEMCDVNCCCDADCDDDDRLVFSHCQERPQNILDERYCFQQHIIFSNNTEYTVDYNHDGVFCIITDNLPERTTYTAVKGATTIEEFEDLKRETLHYSWVHIQSALKFTEEPYTYGSPVWAISQDGYIFNMGIPNSVVGNECEAQTSIRFLQDFQSSCNKVFQYLPEDCQMNVELNAFQYLAFYVIADPSNLYQNTSAENITEAPTSTTTTGSIDETTTVVPSGDETETPLDEFQTTSSPKDTLEKLDPNEKSSAALSGSSSLAGLVMLNGEMDQMQRLPVNISLCHWENETEICESMTLGDVPQPVYNNGTCHNILSSLHYTFVHNGTSGLLQVHAKVHLTNISDGLYQSPQTFQTEYQWAATEDVILFKRSGRPGYINGKPLLLGKLVENVTEEGDLKEAIELDTDPENWLTVLSAGPEDSCNTRTQVTFGQDIRSGCVIRVTQDDLLNRCQSLQQTFEKLLLGPVLHDISSLRIASYGDSSVNNAADWVPILVPEVPRSVPFSSSVLGKTKCAEMILSLHLEIAFTLQGALANPQAKVVGIVLHYGEPQDVSMTCIGTSCENQTIPVEIVSSVAFVDVTQPSLPAFAQPPRLDLKLPYDFFYPFLPSSSTSIHCWSLAWLIFIFILGESLLRQM